jgi:hypothetical protein
MHRPHNKAADYLANIAMDAKATSTLIPDTGLTLQDRITTQLIRIDHQGVDHSTPAGPLQLDLLLIGLTIDRA